MMNPNKKNRLEDLSRPEWVEAKRPCMQGSSLTRAVFLKQLVASGALFGGLALLAGCSSGEPENSFESEEAPSGSTRTDGSPSDCGDLSGISAEERENRELYGYVEETSFPDSRCDNCSLYLPPDEEGGCGGCILFSGPVFAEGYCDYWAPKEEA